MAKIVILEQDNSQTLAGTGDIKTGALFYSKRGRVGEAIQIDSPTKLTETYGDPDYSKSVTMYSAYMFLQAAKGLMACRVIHNSQEGVIENDGDRTARFSAAVAKGIITPLSSGVEGADYTPDKIITPVKSEDGYGFRQKDIDSYSFDIYSRSREYKKLTNKVSIPVESDKKLLLNITTGLNVKDKLSFGESPNDSSELFEIVEIKQETVKIPKIELNKPATVNAKSTIRQVFISEEKKSDIITKTDSSIQVGEQEITTADDVDLSSIKSGDTVSFGDQTHKYVVQSIKNDNPRSITIREGLKEALTTGLALTLWKREYNAYQSNPKVLRDFRGSDEIFVSDIDLIGDGDIITFQSTGTTNEETEFVVESKGIYNEDQNQVILDKSYTSSLDTVINKMIKSEFEQRDVCLFYSDNQGEWGNNITVSISESVDYPDTARIISVYEKGVKVESFEVTFKDFVDGIGKQLYIEDRINGNSNYIRVKHNTECLDDNGEPMLPLCNDYSVWRELPEDIFEKYATPIYTRETLTYGETDVKLTGYQDMEIGDRIKIGDFDQEYKITGKSTTTSGGTTEYHITIDRPIEVDEISINSEIVKFVRQDYKPCKKLDTVYFNKKIGDILTISGVSGEILDCGGNLFEGGNDGTLPDTGDFIQAAEKVFGSRDDVTVNQFLSCGIFSSAYQQKLITLAEKREDCFVWCSNDPSYMDNTNPVEFTKKFRSDLNINSSYGALVADWVEIYDDINKKNVYVPNDGICAALQSLASEGGVWGFVGAGWSRGKLYMVQKLGYTWSEEEREELLKYQINPVKKHKSKGLSLWGNKTLLGTRSYLQMRNVRFMLIQMNIMLRDYLEDIHWEFNDEGKRNIVVQTIQSSFYNKFREVTNKIQVFDVTTSQDEDDGNMKIYIGVQPKGVVDDITVTLGIFSQTREITVQ